MPDTSTSRTRRSTGFRLQPMLLSLLLMLLCLTIRPLAGEVRTFPGDQSQYQILIDDQADLLSTSEEDRLVDTMMPITRYGHVGFASITRDTYSTVEDFASAYFKKHFGTESGTIFLIDMDKRKVCVFSDGEIYETVTTSKAYSITDNIYQYASDQDYYTCAKKAFEQIQTLLSGGRIAEPMKLICNLLLAVALALLLLYFYVTMTTEPVKAADSALLKGLERRFSFTNVLTRKTHTTKRYEPRSSDDDSSSGGGGSSSSGGGGSHSF